MVKWIHHHLCKINCRLQACRVVKVCCALLTLQAHIGAQRVHRVLKEKEEDQEIDELGEVLYIASYYFCCRLVEASEVNWGSVLEWLLVLASEDLGFLTASPLHSWLTSLGPCPGRALPAVSMSLSNGNNIACPTPLPAPYEDVWEAPMNDGCKSVKTLLCVSQ